MRRAPRLRGVASGAWPAPPSSPSCPPSPRARPLRGRCRHEARGAAGPRRSPGQGRPGGAAPAAQRRNRRRGGRADPAAAARRREGRPRPRPAPQHRVRGLRRRYQHLLLVRAAPLTPGPGRGPFPPGPAVPLWRAGLRTELRFPAPLSSPRLLLALAGVPPAAAAFNSSVACGEMRGLSAQAARLRGVAEEMGSRAGGSGSRNEKLPRVIGDLRCDRDRRRC